ncbi:MAG TPA: hypothetical protein VGM51_15775 [Armatimonadota bacterium]|jgi:hypothetical protein
MSRRNVPFAMLLIAISVGTCAYAAPKPRKPAAKPTKRVVLGTKQLSGDKAELGQMYTLGKSWPMNITLNSVEYSTDRLRFGDEVKVPAGNEKFLVLHYTLHNPQREERRVRYDTFAFTAVDSTDTNMEGRGMVGAESTQQNLDMQLKPGQKVNAYTYIPVPAKATAPKLIIKSGDNLVLRYDLRGKVKPLKGPAVDPADKDGTTALSEVPAQMGKTYQVGVYDVTLDSAAYSSTVLPNQDLDNGARNFVVNATVKNADPQEHHLRYDGITLKYTDQDGADIGNSQRLLAASRDVDLEANIAFGKELKVRFPVKVAKDQVVAKMVISEGYTPRLFVFDMSAVK